MLHGKRGFVDVAHLNHQDAQSIEYKHLGSFPNLRKGQKTWQVLLADGQTLFATPGMYKSL